MSTDLESIANVFQALRFELWEGKTLVFSSTGSGGNLFAQIQKLGFQKLLRVLCQKQHIVLTGDEESCTIAEAL